MFTLLGHRHRKHQVIKHSSVFIFLLLFVLHISPTFYINSGFLSTFFSATGVSMIYTVASLITIGGVLLVRKLLPKIGNYNLFMLAMFGELFALVGMLTAIHPTVVMFSFFLHFISTAIIFFNLDVFLESSSCDEKTGGTRGTSLTFQNLGFILGPIAASLLIGIDSYWKVYAFSILILIPAIILGARSFGNFGDPKYKRISFFLQTKQIIKEKDIFFALLCAFMLRVFFAWMVIYSPLFLHNTIGFTWQATTLIIGLGLIPFVLLEYWLGKLADNRYGEKEFMSLGFVVMAIACAAFVFAPQIPNFILWVSIIFMTRVGASMVEVMSEIYIFKKIDVTDINTISFFRILQPTAYVISPIIATIALYFLGDIKWLFLVLALYLLYGLRYSLALNDTK